MDIVSMQCLLDTAVCDFLSSPGRQFRGGRSSEHSLLSLGYLLSLDFIYPSRGVNSPVIALG